MPCQIEDRGQFLAALVVSNRAVPIFLEVLDSPVAHFPSDFLDDFVFGLRYVDCHAVGWVFHNDGGCLYLDWSVTILYSYTRSLWV